MIKLKTISLLLTGYLLNATPIYAVNIENEFAFGDVASLGQGINRLVTPTFSLATLLVTIYFLIGAVRWIASGGNKESIAAARSMITNAIVGFVLLIFAFLILQFIPQAFGLKFTLFSIK